MVVIAAQHKMEKRGRDTSYLLSQCVTATAVQNHVRGDDSKRDSTHSASRYRNTIVIVNFSGHNNCLDIVAVLFET